MGFTFPPPPPPPINGEEYFEHISLLSAVEQATDRFVMMELGAGYGRWLVASAVAMRTTRNLPVKLIGVEAEPQHFVMLKQHFIDNGINLYDHKLVQAAVAAEAGSVNFTVNNDAQSWYGQKVIYCDDEYVAINTNLKNHNLQESTIVEVPAVTLSSLLENEEKVDLIDADIQGTELDVMVEARDQLNAKVKYVFIGTHGTMQEYGLRELFTRNGWFNVYDFPSNSEWPTQPGVITSFEDGVQYWINPRLVSDIPDGARIYSLVPDVKAQTNMSLPGKRITYRKIVKYLLPYGVVRLIQKKKRK